MCLCRGIFKKRIFCVLVISARLQGSTPIPSKGGVRFEIQLYEHDFITCERPALMKGGKNYAWCHDCSWGFLIKKPNDTLQDLIEQ